MWSVELPVLPGLKLAMVHKVLPYLFVIRGVDGLLLQEVPVPPEVESIIEAGLSGTSQICAQLGQCNGAD